MYRGVIPFIIQLMMLVIAYQFPITWLPNQVDGS